MKKSNMKTLRMITLVLSVITGIYILLALLLRLFVHVFAMTQAEGINSASAIGIIGSSDGPTAIFVATSVNFWSVLPVIIFLISIIINMFLRIKIKKNG